MQLSASVFASDRTPAETAVELAELGVDYLHVDCNDDPAALSSVAGLPSNAPPLDVHLITATPNAYLAPLRELRPAFVALQLERLSPFWQAELDLPAWRAIAPFGLAATASVPVEQLLSYAPALDFVLLMTTTPGQSGGIFDAATFRRIRQLKRQCPGLRVHVDGGVNDEVAFILRNLGVELVVSGSFLLRSAHLGAAVLKLHRPPVRAQYPVHTFMQPVSELPVLPAQGFDLPTLLQKLEDGRLGVVFIVTAEGQFEGLISNADLRRGLLAAHPHWPAAAPPTFVNRRPLTISPGATVTEMLAVIKTAPFPVLYLPVVEHGELLGAVAFQHLNKGEL